MNIVRQTYGVWVFFMLLLAAPAAVAKAPPPTDSLAPMVDRVLPAVVNISTRSSGSMQANPLLQDPFLGTSLKTS